MNRAITCQPAPWTPLDAPERAGQSDTRTQPDAGWIAQADTETLVAEHNDLERARRRLVARQLAITAELVKRWQATP